MTAGAADPDGSGGGTGGTMAVMAVVTGGASGIGAALARALAARGDTVAVADIDGTAAAAVAKALSTAGPGSAYGVQVDVRDPDAVRALVTGARDRHGRLDLLVNNAGIGLGGELEELSLAHWERAIDVNLRGVVHGVQAAYPIMLAQGHGKIANTASLAGLVPAPLLVPYAMTKHAVVGLSLSLRAEAARRGVQVSAICPGVTDTPILDKGGPDDLPKSRMAAQTRDLAHRFSIGLYTPDRLATDILAGLERNRALIVAPASARWAWRLHRAAPRLVELWSQRQVARVLHSVGPG